MSMHSSGRISPRSLPTLTEVVAPMELTPSVGVTADPDHVPESQETETWASRVAAQLGDPFQAQLREAISRLTLEHFRKLEPLLYGEVDRIVRQAVAETLAREAIPRR